MSHWAEDDVKIVSSAFPNVGVNKPTLKEFTPEFLRQILYSPRPEYLNLLRA
jgi:hypothetical protein